MADPFRIRSAATTDLERVAAIERDVFSDPWPASAFVPLLESDALVAEAGDQIAGYLFGRSAADEAEILNLAVVPRYRRQGVGRHLLEVALARWGPRGIARVYLEVRTSNTSAQAFYQALGFELAGVRRGYYSQPPEDATVLAKNLAPRRRK